MLPSNKLLRSLILSVCILAPFSIDIFISGIPDIAKHFAGHNVAMVLGISLLAMCFGQPIYGVLLDKLGRKPVMLSGLIVFCLASLIPMFVSNFWLFVIGKFLQTLGGSACVVGVFAIARDCFDANEMPHIIGYILALIGISPVVAPLVGGYVNTLWGWRASFCVLFVLGVVYLVLLSLTLPETLENKKEYSLTTVFKNYYSIIKIKGFVAYAIAAACAYSIIFSFLNVSPMLLIRDIGISKVSYGWLVAFNAIAMVIMAKLAPHVSQKRSVLFAMAMGATCILIGGASMFLANVHFMQTALWLMLPMFITTIGTGTIRPVSNSAAMSLLPASLAGTAAGAFSFICFAIATLSSSYVLHIVKSSAGFGIWVMVFGLVACISLLFSRR